MRACFLGQNICALGYGVAMVQTPPAKANDAPRDQAERPAEPVPSRPPLPNRMFAAVKHKPHYS